MQLKREDFQATQPLGAHPKVDVLVDSRAEAARQAPRRPWRPVMSGLELLRALVTYRFD